MKKLLQTIILLACFNCYGDNWIQKTSVGGTQRNGAVAFSIDPLGKGYVATGGDGFGGFMNDLQEFDPAANSWTQKASYPGLGRVQVFVFSIGTKGYIGGGANAASKVCGDFWEYDALTDIWTKKADLPAGPRILGYSFSIGSKGYIGAGYDSTYTRTTDFWEYDPATNTWTQKANCAAGPNSNGLGVGTNTRGYICLGYMAYNSDFWEYNPGTDVWTKKANLGGPMRADGVGFSICEKVYVGTGETNGASVTTNQLWEYDPASNLWTQKANVAGGSRDDCVGFSLLNKGYLGTGGMGLSDWYEYTPDSCFTPGVSQTETYRELLSIYPNPFNDKLNIDQATAQESDIVFYDIASRVILQQTITGSITINTEEFPQGIYIYELRNKEGTIRREKVIKQ